jgi:hypothetical protein
MSKPYKTVEIYTHTETVYYDADGEEVGRESNNDTTWDDTEGRYDLTEDEIEDWIDE